MSRKRAVWPLVAPLAMAGLVGWWAGTSRSFAPTGDDHARQAAEAVQKNGAIFVDWPKPAAAIVVTGELWGYIEPCGCAGLENQKGGVSRRHTFLRSLAEQGWPLVPIDVGGQTKRLGEQAEIKFQKTVEALKTIGYKAVGWGPQDLRLTASVIELAAAIDGQSSPFVSANVSLAGIEVPIEKRYRILAVGKRRIGITSVLVDDLKSAVNNDQIAIAPVEPSLAAVVPKLKAGSDYRILLCYGTPEQSMRLATRFTDFNLIVTAGGADEPTNQAMRVSGTSTQFVEVGHKGMYAVVIGLFDDPKKPMRYQRVPLDARFVDSPEMKALKVAYQQELQIRGWAGLGVAAKSHPRVADDKDPRGRFVGSQRCGECHTKAYKSWLETPHAHATDTLVDLKPARQFDPECISCHATGWNPQEYFPYHSGFTSVEATPLLKGNGCENCHGPGAAHAAAESGGSDAGLLAKLRGDMRVARGTKVDNVCLKCHDIDNSPDFDLETYWPQVEHLGKD